MSKTLSSLMLSHLVSVFGDEMREKLWKKAQQGYEGWDDTSDPSTLDHMRESLASHVKRYLDGDPKQFVDIANLAALLWFREVLLPETEAGKVRFP